MTSFNLADLLPKDLTPAQRAGLKLAFHLAVMAISSGLLAGYSYASANGVNWRLLAIVAGSQAFLAVADALKKYFSARGDLPLSTMIDIAQSQVAQKAPQVAYTPDMQAIKTALQSILATGDATAASPTPIDTDSTTKLPVVPKQSI